MIDNLKSIVRQNSKADNKSYVLNLIKEGIQSHILYFVYTNRKFADLIFTGGTCLRRVYGLNRLSVDLDFDYETGRDPRPGFAEQIRNWFHKEHQIKNVEAIIRKGTVKLKLTGVSELFEGTGKQNVFVSTDFSPVASKKYRTEKNLISTPEFSFLARSYDLPTMFSNKICAFLEREFRSGNKQTAPFKARDVYDLYWLCQGSRQKQYQLKPNLEIIFERLGAKDENRIFKLIADKIETLEDSRLKKQLLPFFPDRQFVESFVSSYKETLLNDLKIIFSSGAS